MRTKSVKSKMMCKCTFMKPKTTQSGPTWLKFRKQSLCLQKQNQQTASILLMVFVEHSRAKNGIDHTKFQLKSINVAQVTDIVAHKLCKSKQLYEWIFVKSISTQLGPTRLKFRRHFLCLHCKIRKQLQSYWWWP